MKRIPIIKASQLALLDPVEIIEGYFDGKKGELEPGDNRSYSYWHGWRNGNSDRTGKLDTAQRELSKDYVNEMRKQNG